MEMNEADFFPAKVTCFSSLRAISNINAKLTKKQREMFESTCFGHFLTMHDLEFSEHIVHNLLLREVEKLNKDEMWFWIGGNAARFSVEEFCVVTGLNYGPYPKANGLKDDLRKVKDDLRKRDMRIFNNDLEAAFMAANSDNDMFVVKLALLYFLETVLLGKPSRSCVDRKHVLLTDDLEQFNKYPWGQVCFELTMKGLRMANPRCNRETCNLTGFPYAFQIWAYEAIPTLGHKYALKLGHALPPIVNWTNIEAHSYKQLNKDIFEQKNIQVLTVLSPTLKEDRQGYCQEFSLRSCAVLPTSIQEDAKYAATILPTYQDAPHINPAYSAPYDSSTASFSHVTPSKDEGHEASTPAVGKVGQRLENWDENGPRASKRKQQLSSVKRSHCMEIDIVDLDPADDDPKSSAVAESCQEEAATTVVAIEETKKRNLLVESSIELSLTVEEPGLVPKKHKVKHEHCSTMADHLNSPESLPFQDQGPTSQERTLSSPATEAYTPPQPDSTQQSLPETAAKSTSPPLSPPAPSVASKSSSLGSRGSLLRPVPQANQEIMATVPTSVEPCASMAPLPLAITCPPFSSLGEVQAFFSEIEPMLDQSRKDLLESSQPISAAIEDIDQAKHFIKQCISMNFELILDPSRRDQLNSSLELLLKVGCFPLSVRSLARRFHINFLGNTSIYTNCQESIKRADKKKEETSILSEELANKCTSFNHIMGEFQVATDTIEELTKQLAEVKKTRDALEAQAKDLAESSRISMYAYAHCVVDSKTLEKEKQDSEEAMVEIDALWEHFKRETADYFVK